MVIAIYWALGICLLIAARDPVRHAILIDFTILSSLLHGAVMTYHAFARPLHRLRPCGHEWVERCS